MEERLTAARLAGRSDTREMKLQQRAALCWLLRDRRWHLSDRLCERFARCVWRDEVLPSLDLLAPVDVWQAAALELGAPRRIFRSTLAWLAGSGACELRTREGKEWVRLARPNRQLKQRMARTAAFEEVARGLARSGLAASVRPSVDQMWRELTDPSRPQPDPRGRVLVADEVIAWYAREASRPEAASDDFWFRAGFFTGRSLWYFRDHPGRATQLLAKALLVEVLSGRSVQPPEDALADEGEAAGWAYHAVHEGLSRSMGRSLTVALWDLVCPQDGWKEARPQVVSAVVEADWQAIGRRLSEELTRHAHRRGLRALELACAMPYEHVEARLGGFLGTPEETFLRVITGRAG